MAFNKKKWQNYSQIMKKYPMMNLDMFLLQVQMGNVPGHKLVKKFGSNFSVASGATADMWTVGGEYVFSPDDVADIDSLSSSSATDTLVVTVQGYDINWNEVSQDITLQGQTRVAIPIAMVRQHRMFNSNGTDLVGDVYCYVDTALSGGVPIDKTKIRSKIDIGEGQTQMAIFSIPDGYTGFIFDSYATLGQVRSTTSQLRMFIRKFGQVFLVKNRISLSSTADSSFKKEGRFVGRVESKSDMIIKITNGSSAGSGFDGGFDVLLVDNDYVDLFLAA